MQEKIRLDQLLVNRGYYDSREKARAAVMAGLVFVKSEKADKAGARFSPDVPVDIKGSVHPYVGRGGLKLAKAIDTFGISMDGCVVIDIGASTGGFTDCALQHGARIVYAVDVGYGQLAWRLRQNERVVVMERTNFRYLDKEQLSEGLPEVAVIDLSFISLKLILPVLYPLLLPGGIVVALIKPQFEAGKDQVGKKGVVRDKQIHQAVLEKMISFMREQGFAVKNVTFSPITGGEGNVEFLVYLKKDGDTQDESSVDSRLIHQTVCQAHESLLKK